jgi:hypothetical protein
MTLKKTCVPCAVVGVLLLVSSARGQDHGGPDKTSVAAAEAGSRQAATELLAQKEALAESIVSRAEMDSARAFDATFRAQAKQELVSRSLSDLEAQKSRGGLGQSTLSDTQSDLVYTPVTPCRIFDTRIAGGPMASGSIRSFKVTGDTTSQGGSNCGIPFGYATAAVVNFVAVNPSAPGDLRATPFGTPMPLASILNWAPVTGLNLANGLVITLCDSSTATCTSDITLQADSSSVQIVADVLGYFRKPAPRSFIGMTTAGATTNIGSTCTNYADGVITVVAPVAGRVLLHAEAWVIIDHTAGVKDFLEVYIGISPTDCAFWANGGYPTATSVEAVEPTMFKTTTVPITKAWGLFSPGTYTFYLNGAMSSGQSPGDSFFYANLSATFIPY